LNEDDDGNDFVVVYGDDANDSCCVDCLMAVMTVNLWIL